MKKIILVLVMALFAIHMQAQEVHKKDVPAAVSTAFSGAYASAKDVDWKTDAGNYVAKFEMNDRDMLVTYDASGKLIESKEKVEKRDVPPAILTYVKTTYKEDEVRDLYKVTDANGNVTYKGKVKGKMLVFDTNGNVMN
jgi:hypothetical protein